MIAVSQPASTAQWDGLGCESGAPMRQWRSTSHHRHGNMSKVSVCPSLPGRSVWLLLFFPLLKVTFLTRREKLERECAGQTRGQWRGGRLSYVREMWGWDVLSSFSATLQMCGAVWGTHLPRSPGVSAPLPSRTAEMMQQAHPGHWTTERNTTRIAWSHTR